MLASLGLFAIHSGVAQVVNLAPSSDGACTDESLS